jgi:predicted nucleotidyltransferase
MIWNLQQIYYLVHFHQVRKKLFTFSEIFRITKAIPTTIKSEIKSEIDPYYYLTQSGKGYNNLLEKTINFYSKPELTSINKNNLGLDTGLYSFNNKIYQNPQESYYFWHLFQASNNLKNILKIPGVENIYVFGSSLQGCATKTSDVDIAIQTSKNMAITTRILVKLYLKIINQDVYTFRFGLLKNISLFYLKIGLLSKDEYNKKILEIEQEVWKYRHRAGTKIDAGMFFDSVVTLQSVFYKPVEHLFMYDIRLFSYYKVGKVLIPSLLPISKNIKEVDPNIIAKIIYFILYLPETVYSLWQKYQSHNPNHQVTKKWVNFVPTRPEPKYLVKL